MRLPTILDSTPARLAGAVLAFGLLFGCSGGGGETSGGGGGDTPGFGLTLGQSSGATPAGQNLALNLQVQPTAGFSSAVSLSALNLPGGVSAAFSPNPLTPGTQAAACTFTVGAGAAAVSAHPVQVQASGGGVTRTATYALTITAPVQGFALTLATPSGTLGAGGTLSTGVTLAAQNGFTGAVTLAASGLPAGVQATFQPAAVNLPGGTTSTLTLTASTGVVPATAQAITVQATSGVVSRTATFLLSLSNPNAPGFDLSLSSGSVVLLPGASRELLVTATPRNGFSGALTFGSVALPAGVSAQFTPASVTLGPAALTVTLRISAAASVAAMATPVTVMINGQGTGASAQAGLPLRVAAAGDPVAARLGAVAAVEAKFTELSGQGLQALPLLQGVSTAMAARPEYQTVGIDAVTLSAWGRLKDGVLHIVSANRDPGPPAGAAEAVLPAAGAALPGAVKARLLHSFGTNFEGQTPIDSMRTYLQAKGWTVRSGAEGDAHVGTLKGVSGDGFFYINSHGGRISVDDPSMPDGMMYAVQSSTVVDENYETAFAADLQAKRLVHFTARQPDTVKILGFDTSINRIDTRYAITFRFVDTYMSFASGSVVWLNACYSGRNADFVNAFLRKGAGVVLGWSELLNNVAAYASAPYFVDRMLGANQHEPKESPAQRPFAYDLVLADMASKGLDKDAATGGLLRPTVKTGLPHPPIFAPSIRRLEVDEYNDKLILHGEFGTDPGKVTVGGTELAAQWAADKLTCTLPQSGPGSAGDVVVEVKSVKSNARQLTEWAVPVTYAWVNPGGSTGLRWDGTGTLRLRADIAGYRLKPGEAPEYKLRGGVPTKDSKLTVTASGSHTEGSCTETLSGTGVYVSPAQLGGEPGTMIASAFRIDGKTRQGFLGMGFGFVDSPHKITLSGKDCSGSVPAAPTLGFMDGIAEFPWDQSDDPPVGLILGAMSFTLDNNFGIPAKTKTATDFGGTLTVTLGAAPAKFPPREGEDAGR